MIYIRIVGVKLSNLSTFGGGLHQNEDGSRLSFRSLLSAALWVAAKLGERSGERVGLMVEKARNCWWFCWWFTGEITTSYYQKSIKPIDWAVLLVFFWGPSFKNCAGAASAAGFIGSPLCGSGLCAIAICFLAYLVTADTMPMIFVGLGLAPRASPFHADRCRCSDHLEQSASRSRWHSGSHDFQLVSS